MAEVDDMVVGFTHVFMVSPPSCPVFIQQRWANLNTIYVREDVRRGGVARELVTTAEAWAKGRGAKWVELNVYDFNDAAHAFFAKAGFGPLSHHLWKPIDALAADRRH